jgi:hypothetical protein
MRKRSLLSEQLSCILMNVLHFHLKVLIKVRMHHDRGKIAILDLKFGGRNLAWRTLFLNLSTFEGFRKIT